MHPLELARLGLSPGQLIVSRLSSRSRNIVTILARALIRALGFCRRIAVRVVMSRQLYVIGIAIMETGSAVNGARRSKCREDEKL